LTAFGADLKAKGDGERSGSALEGGFSDDAYPFKAAPRPPARKAAPQAFTGG
jgi:hypothetical protein